MTDGAEQDENSVAASKRIANAKGLLAATGTAATHRRNILGDRSNNVTSAIAQVGTATVTINIGP